MQTLKRARLDAAIGTPHLCGSVGLNAAFCRMNPAFLSEPCQFNTVLGSNTWGFMLKKIV
jgi:hypothetical protein